MRMNFFKYSLHRSHFGSRYKSGPCFTAGLLAFIPGSILARDELSIKISQTKESLKNYTRVP
jgi:hypothetical protein